MAYAIELTKLPPRFAFGPTKELRAWVDEESAQITEEAWRQAFAPCEGRFRAALARGDTEDAWMLLSTTLKSCCSKMRKATAAGLVTDRLFQRMSQLARALVASSWMEFAHAVCRG